MIDITASGSSDYDSHRQKAISAVEQLRPMPTLAVAVVLPAMNQSRAQCYLIGYVPQEHANAAELGIRSGASTARL